MEGSWRVDHGKTGVLVGAFFVFLSADIVDIGESLVGIYRDEVSRSDSSVREVSSKAGLENGKDCVVRRVDGRGA